jgi:hypothetical protein
MLRERKTTTAQWLDLQGLHTIVENSSFDCRGRFLAAGADLYSSPGDAADPPSKSTLRQPGGDNAKLFAVLI